MKNINRKFLSAVLVIAIVLSFFSIGGCMDEALWAEYLESVSDSDMYGYYEDDYIEDIQDDEEDEEEEGKEDEDEKEDEKPEYVLDGKFRKHYTKIKGNGSDVATVMIYMCGSNLESDNGFATADIKEMIKADYSEDVNILIETGGTRKWNASKITDDGSNISSKKNQCWQVMEDDITLVAETSGREPMSDPDTLLDFIDFCTENYPANRYMLILWDHGDGAVGGFGYDEFYTDGTLTIDGVQEALKESGVKFDFVGYDACLMGMLEVGYTMYDYVDYFIASEDYEPGYGWEYEGWLDALSDDTGISTEELGEIIIKDYVKECGRSNGILSLFDLVYVEYVFDKWCEFAYENEETLLNTDYAWETESSDRFSKDVKFDWTDLFYYSDQSHIIDVLAVASTIESDTSEELMNALNAMIVCSYSTSSTAYSSSYMTGLAVALPYGDSYLYESIQEIFPNCGFDDEYVEFLGKFVESESAPNNDEIWGDWGEIWNGWESWEDLLEYEWGEWGSINDYLDEFVGDWLEW